MSHERTELNGKPTGTADNEPVFDASSILEMVGRSAVHVTAEKSGTWQWLSHLGLGGDERDVYNASGFFVDAGRANSCEVVTTNHAVPDGYSSLKVRTAGGQEYSAEVEKRDRANDLAFLKVEMPQPCMAARIEPSSLFGVEPLFAVPFRKNATMPTALSGRFLFNEARKDETGMPLLPHEDPNRPLSILRMQAQDGDSGALIVNRSGRVVGVQDAIGPNTVGMIPSSVLSADIEELKRGR